MEILDNEPTYNCVGGGKDLKKIMFVLVAILMLSGCGDDKKIEKSSGYKTADEVKDTLDKIDDLSSEGWEPDSDEEETATESIQADELEEFIIENGMGENDKLINATLEFDEIKVTIELAPHDQLENEDLAISSYSQMSDALLDLDGWETLNVEYVDVGKIIMNRSEKEINEYDMDYFPTEVIKDRLK